MTPFLVARWVLRQTFPIYPPIIPKGISNAPMKTAVINALLIGVGSLYKLNNSAIMKLKYIQPNVTLITI